MTEEQLKAGLDRMTRKVHTGRLAKEQRDRFDALAAAVKSGKGANPAVKKALDHLAAAIPDAP